MRPSDLLSVVLVEDADDEREMYAEALRLRGYSIWQARTADAGIRLAAEVLPVAVVTDVVLAGSIDGFTLTRTLKNDARTRDIPVIVLTGRVFDSDRREAARVGCDLFLMKPCSPDELVRNVRRCGAIRRLAHIRGRTLPAELLSRASRPARKIEGR